MRPLSGAPARRSGTGRGPARAWIGPTVGAVTLVAALVLWRRDLAAAGSTDGKINTLALFLLAVAVIVFVSHLLGVALGALRQPPVVGEIIGGLLLGPSVFGALWPSAREWLFPPEVMSALQLAAQLGLVTFMFLCGCELRVGRERSVRRGIVLVVIGAMGLPFLAGTLTALPARHLLAEPSAPVVPYALFVGLAVSITALPVLGRILTDLRLQHTRIGRVALSSAAVGDGAAWAALTALLAVISASQARVPTTLGLVAAFVLVSILCVRPALAAFSSRMQGRAGGGQLTLAVLAAGALGFAAITELIGLHPVVGAFLFGTLVPRDSAAVDQVTAKLHGFVVAILLPLFFAGVGLNTAIGLLGSSLANWLLFTAVLAVAVVAKFVGAGGGARLAGMTGRDAARVGVLMNCRGVTEIVVATVGFQYHLISSLGLTILVLVALVTTAATGPLIRVLATPSPAQDATEPAASSVIQRRNPSQPAMEPAQRR